MGVNYIYPLPFGNIEVRNMNQTIRTITDLQALRYKLEKAWDTGMTVEDADIEAVADAIALLNVVAIREVA